MRSIVRRDTGESYQEFLTRLAKASGIETPTRDDLARLDRTRKKKTSNKDWTNPYDPDAKVTKMKDGRTHLAHKAEHAVDLETGAIVAVTVQGADEGDTTTIVETAIDAALGGGPILPGEAARIVRRTPTQVVVAVQATSPALLVVTDTHYPGWRARVGDAPAPLLRVNFAFRGVVVPPGPHKVTFDYAPASVTWGAALSGVGLVLAAALWRLAPRTRR